MTALVLHSLEEKKTHNSSVWHPTKQKASSTVADSRFLKASSPQQCCLFSPHEKSVAYASYSSFVFALFKTSTVSPIHNKIKLTLGVGISKMETVCILLSADPSNAVDHAPAAQLLEF